MVKNALTRLSLSSVFTLILIAAFAVRLTDLNYNSPFSDEAIYIVLGKLGVFQWDWTSYAAGNWMAGSLFAYPPLTAMAYTTFGIVGSRFLNVIFGVLAIKTIAQIAGLLSPHHTKTQATLITAFIMATATLSIAASRLATYDMPSFLFLFQSLYCILKAYLTPKKDLGKWYFLAVISLFLAGMMKIVSLAYWPLIIFIGIYDYLRHPQALKRFFWWRYFFIPLVVMLLLYLSLQTHGILIYLQSHGSAESVSWPNIFAGVKPYLMVLLPLWLFGSLVLLFRRQFPVWFWLTLCAFWIILLHFGANRLSTFDKHLFFTEGFVAIICGLGLSRLPQKLITLIPAMMLVLACSYFSVKQGFAYGRSWLDTSAPLAFLSQKLKPGDLILSEEGPSVMLAAYSQSHPSQVTTFDWFSYQKNQGLTAYTQAVSDAHFNYILLYKNIDEVSESLSPIQAAVESHLSQTYQPVYDDGIFMIYQRVYQ